MKRRDPTKARLTEASIRGLSAPEDKPELLVWDELMPGLVLRVGRQRRSWVYVYRPAGTGRQASPRKLALGTWPALSAAAARQAAQIEAGRIARGEDPAAARREARRQERATVAAVLERYEATLRQRHYVNTKTVMSTLRRGLADVLTRDVATLTRAELVQSIDALEAANRPGAAADLRKHLRTLMEWTTSRGLTPYNVLAGLRRERATRAQRIEVEERGRALTDGELAAVWHASDPGTNIGRYFRALVLTGARRSEIARLHRSMDRGDRLVLPPTHTKQGRPHEIPVTPALRAILNGCPILPSGLLFASERSGGELKGWTQHLAKLRAASGVNFTPHDLRRTMRSNMNRLGVDRDTAELMLGHQRADDLERLYDRDSRWPERVAAAERWSAHVLAVCAANPEREAGAVLRPAFRATGQARVG